MECSEKVHFIHPANRLLPVPQRRRRSEAVAFGGTDASFEGRSQDEIHDHGME